MTTYIGKVRKLLPWGSIVVRFSGGKGFYNLYPSSRRVLGVVHGDGGVLLSVYDTNPSRPIRRPKVDDLVLVVVEGILEGSWALLPKDITSQERF